MLAFFRTMIMLTAAMTTLSFVTKPVRMFSQASSLQMNSFYDLTEKDYKGNAINFSQFKGKVVYGVNVASKCGYTASGYALLSRIAKIDGYGIHNIAYFHSMILMFIY
jgi:hypothetical protein